MFSGCGPGSQCCLEVWSRAFVHAIDGCLVPTLVNRCASYAHIATANSGEETSGQRQQTRHQLDTVRTRSTK